MEKPGVDTNKPQCEHCGRCLQVCPSYRYQGIETFSPRGRLDLIRALASKELTQPTLRYQEAMGSCLQCLACHRACPKGVDGAAAIQQEKSRLLTTRKNFQTTCERIFLSMILANRHAFYSATRGMALLQHLFLNKQTPTVRHLPLFLPEMVKGRRIPDFSARSIFSQLPATMDPPAHVPIRGHVTLFTGCYFGYIEIEPALAAVKVLGENGFGVRIKKDHSCCGAPSYLGGYPDIARKTAEKNLANLDGTDPIITLCATCGNALKNDYPRMFPSGDIFNEKAENLSNRICDISQFLSELSEITLGNNPIDRTITIHDPCHLDRGLGVSTQIRVLLEKIPGLKQQEMKKSDNCCGGGGLCALNNPDLSRHLGIAKAEAILKTNASLAITPCPGCLLQIRDALSHSSTTIRAMHPIELMAATFPSFLPMRHIDVG